MKVNHTFTRRPSVMVKRLLLQSINRSALCHFHPNLINKYKFVSFTRNIRLETGADPGFDQGGPRS